MKVDAPTYAHVAPRTILTSYNLLYNHLISRARVTIPIRRQLHLHPMGLILTTPVLNPKMLSSGQNHMIPLHEIHYKIQI